MNKPMSLTQINEDTTVEDKKYVVFKRAEFEAFSNRIDLHDANVPVSLEDATVIRGQDLFAAPALDSYANSIGVALLVMPIGSPERNELLKVADYFHQRAQEARMIGYKLPDNGDD